MSNRSSRAARLRNVGGKDKRRKSNANNNSSCKMILSKVLKLLNGKNQGVGT